MRIMTIAQLEGQLDKELAHRKRRLTSLKFRVDAVKSKNDSVETEVVLQSSLCLLYAHWEGGVKVAAEYYCNFVEKKGLSPRALSDGLLAACILQTVKQTFESPNVNTSLSLVELLRGEDNSKKKIAWESVVRTKSNLDYDTFVQILDLASISHAPYSGFQVLLNEKVVAHRHAAAHSGFSSLLTDDYDLIHSAIVKNLSKFYDDLRDAAFRKLYLA